MGNTEAQTAQRARRAKIQQKLMLILFRITTRSSAAAFAPESVLLKRLYPEAVKGSPTQRMRQALRRLETKGLLRRQKTERGWTSVLTPQGRVLAEKLHTAERVRIRKPRVWDQKWRIVIFDIWERRRGVRDKLRATLQKAGFRRVQDSVWVCPYDCEEFVALLRADLKLGQGILYLIAEGIENDSKLRKLFDL